MSIVFNPEALERVLHSSLGMVGVFVERKSSGIRDQVAKNAGDYYGSAPELSAGVADDVSLHMDGSTGVIAINPSNTGHKWGRLIRKAQDNTWTFGPKHILEQSKF